MKGLGRWGKGMGPFITCVNYSLSPDHTGEGVIVHPELMVLNSIVLPHKDLTANFKNQIIL